MSNTLELNQENLFLRCALQSIVYRAYTTFHIKRTTVDEDCVRKFLNEWLNDLTLKHKLLWQWSYELKDRIIRFSIWPNKWGPPVEFSLLLDADTLYSCTPENIFDVSFKLRKEQEDELNKAQIL